MRGKSYSKDELEKFILDFVSIEKRIPYISDFNSKNGMPSYRQYYKYWGSKKKII